MENDSSKNFEILREALVFLNIEKLPAFAKHTGLPVDTLRTWKQQGVSKIGTIALKNIIEVERLKRELNTIDDKDKIRMSEDLLKIKEITNKYN